MREKERERPPDPPPSTTPPTTPPTRRHNLIKPYLNHRYEAEFFKNQLQLEADRQAEASHARLLQDDVVKLQERIASLLASGAAGGGGGGGGASSGGGGGGPDVDAMVDQLRMSCEAGSRIKGLMTDHSRKDREVMLRQVEALKTARQEAEFVKSENVRLQGELTAIGRVRNNNNNPCLVSYS